MSNGVGGEGGRQSRREALGAPGPLLPGSFLSFSVLLAHREGGQIYSFRVVLDGRRPSACSTQRCPQGSLCLSSPPLQGTGRWTLTGRSHAC